MTKKQCTPLFSESLKSKGQRSINNAAEHGAPKAEIALGVPAVLDDLEADAMARRRLLKLAAYTIPVVVGTLVTRPAAAASCGPLDMCNPTASCGPLDMCNPTASCHPECFPANH